MGPILIKLCLYINMEIYKKKDRKKGWLKLKAG